MKKLLFAGLLLASCTHSNKSGTFVSGTYVNHAESEYSTADDTLVISANQVIRRTGFQRKGGQPQYKSKTYTAIWDKGVLQLPENGLVIVFGDNQVLIANTQYRKL